jgi:hypothetical protein
MKKIISESKSLHEVSLKYFGYVNVKTYSKIREYINVNGINTLHFIKNPSAVKHTLYPRIKKICPICEKEFETKLGHKREKTVCSHSCANTYYRTGSEHPNYKSDKDLNGSNNFRVICFRHHEKKCVCCDEKNIVETHHYDGNKKNNLPKNLVPLCPTHHRYWHSRFRYIVKVKVDEYVKNFMHLYPPSLRN